jgi:urease accessory protein UreF
MLNEARHAIDEGLELLGEWHPLLQQLGSTEGLVTLNSVADALRLPRIESIPGLVRFLEGYRDQVLLPLDLPIIYRAFGHASRNELRELLALDQSVGNEILLRDFASASRRVGQASLRRLRPLKDERLVQRYLRAMEEGQASGWHSVVYGITLALYSLPIRQGLLHYATQTLTGFFHAAACSLKVSETKGRELLDALVAGLPAFLEKLLLENASEVSRRSPR